MTKAKKEMDAASRELVTYEENFTRLQEIVNTLQSGNPSLEEGMALFKEGVKCSQICRTLLENAKQELQKWQEEGTAPVQANPS